MTALLIGVDQYSVYSDNTKRSGSTLPYAAKDIERIRNALVGLGVHEKDIYELVNEKATSQGIQDAVSRVARNISKTETLVVYIAGHAIRDTKGNGTFLTHDSQFGFDTMINQIAGEFPDVASTVWIDACYVDPLANLSKKGEDLPVVFYCTSPNDMVYAVKGEGGLFTNALCHVLNMAEQYDVSPRDNGLSAKELLAALKSDLEFLTSEEGFVHVPRIWPGSVRTTNLIALEKFQILTQLGAYHMPLRVLAARPATGRCYWLLTRNSDGIGRPQMHCNEDMDRLADETSIITDVYLGSENERGTFYVELFEGDCDIRYSLQEYDGQYDDIPPGWILRAQVRVER